MQRPGSKLIFKTDSLDYFNWSLTRFQRSPYKVAGYTYDLHASEFAGGNFITQFENIFLRQGLKIGYAVMERS
jgi:tRNA (guanine-N7-)-methyltransferase